MIDLHDYHWGSRSAVPPDPIIRIYCEGVEDQRLYSQLLGPSLGRWIRFVGPPNDQLTGASVETGSGGANRMARLARRQAQDGGHIKGGVYNAYCLLDGEERLRADGRRVYCEFTDLIIHRQALDYGYIRHRQHLVFEHEDLDHVLFLNCNELENLYFLYSDAWNWMEADWDRPQIVNGDLLGVDDLWRLLHRAVVVATVERPFKRFCGSTSKRRKTLMSDFFRKDRPILPLAEEAAILMRDELEPDIARHALADLEKSMLLLKKGRGYVQSRAQKLLRMCNGEVLYNLGFKNPATWRDILAAELIANGFAAEFQMGLVYALMGPGRILDRFGRRDKRERIQFGFGQARLVATLRRGIPDQRRRRRFPINHIGYCFP